MHRLIALSASATAIALNALPAMAGPPAPVPEPGTMLGVGIMAAYVIKRVGRRKN